MTARTVVGNVEFPVSSGVPCVGARVVATLYAGSNVAYGVANDVAVGNTATLTDGTGAWVLELEPNSSITPAGTVWQVTITRPGGDMLLEAFIDVPDETGSHAFVDLLAEQPGALASQPLVAHMADDEAHGFVTFTGSSTDATSDLQTLVNDLVPTAFGVAGTTVCVRGEIVLSDTITIDQGAINFVGDGIGNSPAYSIDPGAATVFRWAGGANKPMFKITDSRGCSFRGIRFEGNDSDGVSAINLFAPSPAVTQGTNERFLVEDCWFGRWEWSSQGTERGDLTYGIRVNGDSNSNNDEFYVERCVFRRCDVGLSVVNTQSIWGAVRDCRFDNCGVGVATAANLTLFNYLGNGCDVDFDVQSTAHVKVFGYHSESMGRIADMAASCYLSIDDGVALIASISGYEAGVTAGTLINMFPSNTANLELKGISFVQNSQSPRPRICFGPQDAVATAGPPGFVVRIRDCFGLYSDQLFFGGPDGSTASMWAASPESVGVVEFVSRTSSGTTAFRSLMRYGDVNRRALNTTSWDLAVGYPNVDPQRVASTTTAARPDATAAGAGATIYDSTLGMPIWSNGSVWKNAAGTTV